MALSFPVTPAATACNRRARSAFTLVELLVVIGIIALLISILLPSLSKANEQAKRIACASNVRQFCTALLMYADENKGRLMDVGNHNKQWNNSGNTAMSNGIQTIHPAARDLLVDQYKLTRRMFFCPSNVDMDDGNNWERTDLNNFAFTGYMFIAGRKELNVSKTQTTTFKGFEEVPDGIQIAPGPKLTGPKAYYEVLVADTTRSWQNTLSPSNHIRGEDPTGYLPRGNGGANIGFIDGHVEWKPQNSMGQESTGGRRNFYGLDLVRYYF
jgi:prepilin-type processing-associated H-X9-DG protein/prepilin-type N-terminal cleavage/methylation domain-containing protein